jgi:signal peptidase I
MRKYLKFLTCIVVVLALWAVPFKIVVVKGDSMLPNLKNNQVLLAVKTNNFSVDDIVVAKNDYRETIIKRIKFVDNEVYYYVLGLHSEKVEIYDEHVGVMALKYYKGNDQYLVMKQIVPRNHVYLLGDNIDNSDDSRRFGPVEKKDIMYKVISK